MTVDRPLPGLCGVGRGSPPPAESDEPRRRRDSPLDAKGDNPTRCRSSVSGHPPSAGMPPADLSSGLLLSSLPAGISPLFPNMPEERWRAVLSQASKRGTQLLVAGCPEYPITEELPGRPNVLFVEGRRQEVLKAPRVAIVGTRSASVHGLADAWELGAFLGAAGVSVVSGLAIGIDGAAHHGALQAAEALRTRAAPRGDAKETDDEGNAPTPLAGPIGVVATGLDIVYPRRHRALFERVREHGVLVGEQPFGVQPDRGRFPIRNRIIAALADVVVVVEATLSGGSRITADRALDYGRPVLAMPGSRRNPAAAGCNALIADGAQPLLDPSDVLVALGLTPGARRLWGTAPAAAKPAPPSAGAAAVLKALAGEAAHPDQLVSRTGLDPGQVALAVEELVALGHATRDRGFVWPI